MEDTYAAHEDLHMHRRVRFSFSPVYLAERFIDFIVDAVQTMAREATLFIGVGLTLIGVFSFSSGKFCDGNSADYLSCTRPATYYYYDKLMIALIVLGAFMLLMWYMRRVRIRG